MVVSELHSPVVPVVWEPVVEDVVDDDVVSNVACVPPPPLQ